uniref:RRM domain-containing protein n=1 Tax=Magallana gigas TaxID=29159 RepID=A0A8W8N940_MAGGI|nr:polyadenylate-binding protein 1 isoform X2 [Crassostrea gigas]
MYDCIKIDMASFEDPEAAEKAVEALNGNDNAGKILYVGRDQKEIERQAELKEKFERIRMERINRYQGVNLYVKNLADNIDDERLRKEFAQFGTITSAKVMATEDGRSKGFGFVCFCSPEEATKAIVEMNEKIIEARPLYVALAQRKEDRKAQLASQYMQRTSSRDMPEHRIGPGVNLFIKNLDKSIDDEKLREEFSQFGTITSAKVMTKNDKSKGFGFVSFSSPEEASTAISEMHGRIVVDKPLYVALAQRKEDRRAHLALLNMQDNTSIDKQGEQRELGVNVYVKNLDDNIDDERLREEFAQFGTITSAKVMTEDGLSKKFGFVCFSSPEEASKAIEKMNGRIVVAKPLYVALAQKKEDREAHLALLNMQDNTSMDRQGEQRELGVNVYVKNLDDNIDDERLREEFAQFGTITSAKVMTEDGLSKKFGFVCFSSPEEASKAIEKMNGRIVVAKPLYVALAQKKEDREAHLASQYMQRMRKLQGQQKALVSQMFQ